MNFHGSYKKNQEFPKMGKFLMREFKLSELTFGTYFVERTFYFTRNFFHTEFSLLKGIGDYLI